jgi:hypothetical protein
MTLPYQAEPNRKDLLPIGQLVQYNLGTDPANPNFDNPRAPVPDPGGQETMVGIVRGAYTAQGFEWYTVVWNPGGQKPITGEYKRSQLKPVKGPIQAPAFTGNVFTPADVLHARTQNPQGTY